MNFNKHYNNFLKEELSDRQKRAAALRIANANPVQVKRENVITSAVVFGNSFDLHDQLYAEEQLWVIIKISDEPENLRRAEEHDAVLYIEVIGGPDEGAAFYVNIHGKLMYDDGSIVVQDED